MTSPAVELTAEIVRRAKGLLIQRDGIGAEITPVVISFGDDDIMTGFAQMSYPSKDAMHQYRRMAAAAAIMRSAWHASRLVVVLEGFVAISDDGTVDTLSQDLITRFANGDTSVKECLSVISCDSELEISTLILPYKLMLGKQIEWDNPIRYPDGANQGAYASMLLRVMTTIEQIPYSPMIPMEAAILTSSIEIHDLGFFVTSELIGESQKWLDEIQYGNDEKKN